MAPGQENDPLVSCLNGMKNLKLLNQLIMDQQSTIGIIPYFVQNSGATLNRTNYSEVKKMEHVMETINLFKLNGIIVDVITEKSYTHYIHIHDIFDASVKLPIDPTDNTLMSSFESKLFRSLKDKSNKEEFLQTLSEKLRNEIGAKQLIVLSEKDDLPGYTPPHSSGCDRFRFANPDELLEISENFSKNFIADRDKACQYLEDNFDFIISKKALLAKTNKKERYREVNSILEEHAHFTQSKQDEYKEEELQGKASRFENDFVTPIVLVDKKTNKIFGMIRATDMGNGFYYLSDEVMNQKAIPLNFFKGNEAMRESFLLGYLMKHTKEILVNQVKCFFIIAASGRTDIYDSLGFKTFENPLPVSNWKLMVQLSCPGPVLKNMVKKIKSLPFEPTNLQPSISNSKHGIFFTSCENEKTEETPSTRQGEHSESNAMSSRPR